MMKYIIKTLFILICSGGFAQELSFGERLEFELKDDYSNEQVYTFGSDGVVMRAESDDDDENGNTTWKYDFYGTDMQLKVSVPVKLRRNIDYDETYIGDKYIHDLYTWTKKKEYHLVTLEVETGKLYKVEGEIASRKMYIRDMKVMGDYAFFYARLKRAPVLFSVNWKTGEKKVIPINMKGVKPRKLIFLGMQILEESNEVFVYLDVPTDRKENETYVMRLGPDGEKKDVFQLTDEKTEEGIVDISARRVGDEHYIYTGTYGYKSTSSSSAGLFFAESKNGKLTQGLKLYKFTDLDNFLSYLSEKKQERIEKKKKRKKKRGKELKLSYSIADHEVKIVDDGYLFIGEAYYATYVTYTTTSYVNGVPTMTTHQRFDGYQYTHAVIGKFDKQGNLVWDQTFEMWPSTKPFYVKRFISIQEENANSIDLAFASRGSIHTMSFSFDGEVLKESESEEIDTKLEGDETKRSDAELEYWYDNYFVTYGTQKIKNKEQEDRKKKKRRVFFIQKIEF